MLEETGVATKAGGGRFAADEMATDDSIAHGMGCVEFMVFCDERPGLPIACDCGCPSVARHNGRVRGAHPDAYARFIRTGV